MNKSMYYPDLPGYTFYSVYILIVMNNYNFIELTLSQSQVMYAELQRNIILCKFISNQYNIHLLLHTVCFIKSYMTSL